MKHRIIVHVEDGQDEQGILERVVRALPVYRGYHEDKGQRLTARITADGALIIYNTWKDAVIYVLKNLKP